MPGVQPEFGELGGDLRLGVGFLFLVGHDLVLPCRRPAGGVNWSRPLYSGGPLVSDPVRDRLLQLFKSRAVRFGDFTLASGQRSTYYINSKQVLFHSEAVALLGELLYQATADLTIEAVGG